MKKVKLQSSNRKLGLAIFLLSFFILGANQALAGTATLKWNANTESDLAGYKIYYGTSPRNATCPTTSNTMAGYATVVDVGKTSTPTSPSYVFSNLTDGSTYYFSTTAYDTSNNQSCFSGEVSKVIPATTGKKGDLNADGKVDVIDLGIFLSNWGATSKPASDLNADGKVDVIDLGLLLGNWG